MDIATSALAESAVQFLMPFLKKMAEGTAGELGKKIAGAPAELYHFIKSRFADDATVLDTAARNPDDATARAQLEAALAKKLHTDDAFSQQVRSVVATLQAGATQNNFETNIHGSNNKNANIGDVHGDVSF